MIFMTRVCKNCSPTTHVGCYKGLIQHDCATCKDAVEDCWLDKLKPGETIRESTTMCQECFQKEVQRINSYPRR